MILSIADVWEPTFTVTGLAGGCRSVWLDSGCPAARPGVFWPSGGLQAPVLEVVSWRRAQPPWSRMLERPAVPGCGGGASTRRGWLGLAHSAVRHSETK